MYLPVFRWPIDLVVQVARMDIGVNRRYRTVQSFSALKSTV
jgi:hypothetical protein